MSQPTSTGSTSDGGSNVSTTISFNKPGDWGVMNAAMGPALALPAVFADLKLGGNISIEFLHIGSGKNHVVLRVPLEEPVQIEGTDYYAVRIAMDLADEEFVVLDNSEVRA